MIALIFITIFIEIVVCIWIIGKLNTLLLCIESANKILTKQCFKGNLDKIKFGLILFNKKLETISEENEKKDEKSKITKIINSLLLIVSVVSWLKRNGKILNKKHK